jgi:hypothetical protein
LLRLARLSDHGAVAVQEREIEVAVRGASRPLAHTRARDVVRASNLGDVDTARDVGERGEDVPYIMSLPGQSVARKDPLP